jgi:hypothetical protein
VATLGADALPAVADAVASGEVPPGFTSSLTLTRLHVRYGKDSLGEDLIFRAAPPIEGGRGVPGPNGELPRAVQPASSNNFQGRYVIRHPWTGPIKCERPQRGIWGGPWQQVAADTSVKVATNTAFAPRGGVQLNSLLASPLPELSGKGGALPSGSVNPPPWPKLPSNGCAGCSLAGDDGRLPAGALAAAAIAALLKRRRDRRA